MPEQLIDFPTHRSAVYARGGMLASSQPLASAAGARILAQGGNAADAAVACAAALNVTEPTSTGLGGDMFALFYDAQTRQVSALNGSGRAPAGLSLERLHREGPGEALPPFHAHTVTVPGACAGWCDLIERHGTLPLSQILGPAIQLASQGFPVSPITAHFWQNGAKRQLQSAPNGHELTLNGRGPQAGEIFSNPGLARTLQTIAEGGKQAFYEGPIARAIVDVLRGVGGCMSEADLAAHQSTWEQSASVTHAGLRLHECPPNGQGLTALLALNLLEGFEVLGLDPLSPQRLHLQIECLRLAFADARWYVSDPAFNNLPLEALLSKEYAAERRKLINPAAATLDQQRGRPVSSSDTVYFCAVDRWGNACSFINSNYMGFGTGIVPQGWGFTLQNRGHNFSLQVGHPNALAPGKRPYHTIIPALITRESDGSLFGPFGVMGGFMQPQGHVQVFLALAQGLDPQSALDLPRFCIEDGQASDGVALEDGIPLKTMARLAEMGHPVRPVTGWARALFGRGQVITRTPDGTLCGGSDTRADGCAQAVL
jgi:gamma-glutamyltranspeptidase/glutathione hydrolase